MYFCFGRYSPLEYRPIYKSLINLIASDQWKSDESLFKLSFIFNIVVEYLSANFWNYLERQQRKVILAKLSPIKVFGLIDKRVYRSGILKNNSSQLIIREKSYVNTCRVWHVLEDGV